MTPALGYPFPLCPPELDIIQQTWTSTREMNSNGITKPRKPCDALRSTAGRCSAHVLAVIWSVFQVPKVKSFRPLPLGDLIHMSRFILMQ